MSKSQLQKVQSLQKPQSLVRVRNNIIDLKLWIY